MKQQKKAFNRQKKNRRIRKDKMESNLPNGQCIRNVDRHFIGGEDTLLWVLRGDLKEEAVSETIAAQHQALQTKLHVT